MSETLVGRGGVRVVVVEDEEDLRRILVAGLAHYGFAARGARDGTEMDRLLAESPADMVVLDVRLPDEDGLAIAARLRRETRLGLAVVTARGALNERLQGLTAGADLYFVKPVDIAELAAALRNLGQRLSPGAGAGWRFDEARSRLVTPGGVEALLTAHECAVMARLAACPGAVVPRGDLHAALGQADDEHSDRRLETLLSRLRAKVVRLDPQAKLPVRARHGAGYAFLEDIRA